MLQCLQIFTVFEVGEGEYLNSMRGTILEVPNRWKVYSSRDSEVIHAMTFNHTTIEKGELTGSRLVTKL